MDVRIGKPTSKLKLREGETLTPEEKKFYQTLHGIIDKIYEAAKNDFQMNWNQLAGRAGLTYHTVYALGERLTRYPQFLTVYKLAKAVGWELGLKEIKSESGVIKIPEVKRRKAS